MSKEIFGYISVVFALLSMLPYMFTVHKGKTKPHLFSWVIWAIPTAVVFTGQVISGAGAGAWASGFTLLCNIFIVFQSFKYADKNITRSDWIYFISGLTAIPLWIIAKDPLYSIILSTIIDMIAFGPTVRKSWNKPYDESVTTYIMCPPKHVFALLAMQNYSLVNIIFPCAMIVVNTTMYIYLVIRRRQIGKP